MPTEDTSMTATTAPKRGKKYFTLEEANRALCYVSRIVENITSCYRKAVRIRQRLERPGPEQSAEQLREEYEIAMNHLNDLIDELQQVGVELKDVEKGLLDFPCVHEGRESYLCWHRGEESIRCWHEVDAGYSGRKDVALLQAAKETSGVS